MPPSAAEGRNEMNNTTISPNSRPRDETSPRSSGCHPRADLRALVLSAFLVTLAAPSWAGKVLFVSDSSTDSENIPFVLSGSGAAAEIDDPDISGARFRPAAGPGLHDVTIIRDDYTVTGGSFGLAEGANPQLANLPLGGFCSVFWSASGPHQPDGLGGGLGADGGLHTDPTVFANLNTYVAAGGFVFVTGHDAVANPGDILLTEFIGGPGAASGETFSPLLSLPGGTNALTLGPNSVGTTTPSGGGINTVDGVQEQDYIVLYDANTSVVVSDLTAGVDPPAGSWTVRHPGGAADEFINNGHVAYVANGIFLYEDLPSSPGTFLSAGEDDSWLFNAAYKGALLNFAHNACLSLPFDAGETPVADDQSISTPLNTPVPITLTGSDPNGDPLTFAIDTGPASGSLAGAPPNITYSPNASFDGIDSFTFRVSDAERTSNPATVTIEVLPNTAPVANDDSIATDEDTLITFAAPGVLLNDTDAESDPLTAVLDSGVSNGTLTLNADGSLGYTPAFNFCGSDSFTYHANDGTDDSNVATVSIDVACINDDPVAKDDAYATNEDTPLTVVVPGVLSNDSDVDGDTLTVTATGPASNGAAAINADGSFTYTPNPNFNGSDSFVYTIGDGNGGVGTGTVTIRIYPVNDAPVAADDVFAGTEDFPLIVPAPGVLANDVDVDGDTLTAALATAASNGVIVFNADGSFAYTPNPQFCGTDSFTYQASDASLPSNTAVVTLNIACVNDPPVTNDDSFNMDEDTTLIVPAPGVISNDFDIDGDVLTAILVGGPANGALTLNGDGSLSYTPNANYFGSDSFTYKVNDGQADSDQATVSITINPVNDAPVIQQVTPSSQAVDYSDYITDITITATDVDSPVLSLAGSGIPASVVIGGGCTPDNSVPAGTGGSCSWTLTGVIDVPAASYRIGLTVTDGPGLEASASTDINVEAEDATATLDEDNDVALQVASDGGDSGAFSLTVSTRETNTPDNAEAGPAAAGDIGNAVVTIVLEPVGPGSNIPGSCVTASNGLSGYDEILTTVCDFDGVPVNTYSVVADVNGAGYYTGGDVDALTIYDPSLGFTTGGGWFYWPGTDDRTNFGYTMKYGKNGRNVKGSLLLIRRAETGKYRIKSNAIEGLALGEGGATPDTFGWASFSGKATYMEPGWVDAVGNYEFTTYVEDLGEPGADSDRFWLEVRDKDRVVVPDLSMADPADAEATIIDGGNIVVPHADGGGGGGGKKK
jgi:VCBS repeat-containing protein